MKLDKDYWESKWNNQQTGWDIGYVSTPIARYIDQIKNKNCKILIPGSGNSYEGEYLWKNGFRNVFLLDHSSQPFESFLNRCPDFPKDQLLVGDFFEHASSYDIIIEQTFFCALDPTFRNKYVRKMTQLLKDDGLLIGLLFKIDFGNNHPPFGGTKKEYLGLFSTYFEINVMEESYNSIPQRQGSELFIELKKS